MASPSSLTGIARPESMIVRPRSESRFSNPASRPETAASTRYPDEEPKTAVKVAVRVRPPLDSSDPGFDLVPARFRGSTCQTPNPNTLTVESGAQGQKLFVFDRVFSDKEDQESVWEYVHESVNSFVQGYNVSLLAYGQSGAGKSYTMGTASPGSQITPKSTGIVPRAAAALFDKLSATSNASSTSANGVGSGLRQPKRYSSAPVVETKEKNWQLRATYVEIYNEQLRDLLVPESVPSHERPPIQIREDSKGRILLTGLQQVPINSVDDLLNALNFGSSIRQTDATAINSKSSRSHAVFSLALTLKKNQAMSSETKRYSTSMHSMSGSEHWVTIDSKLHFVDLAGSERLKNSGLTGERVKEGISINAGLASLGKVISQLSAKSSGGGGHVSYRDSRLTRLLQDSLGGNAITYMIACVNPVEFHLSETLNTVQYAQRARNIQSKPQIQSRADDGDKQLVIDRLRSEVAFLRDRIQHLDRGDRRSTSEAGRRAPRDHARENELQNQLLDIQESYSALSGRHAKLIAEIAQGKGNEEGGMPALTGSIAPNSLDRLKRSNNFQEAVEAVVMEYEKTIQSLESSLSQSRSSLSTSESSLLEREARLVYSEARTQQLLQRLQKSKDRESNSDTYLRDLEQKLEGAATGEEKNIVAIKDLRKELARVKESESSAEEYISTLEERLAEAEQDTEIMQREIRRLEHVVERQRTIGKMDSLLQELDHMRQEEIQANSNGADRHMENTQSDMFHDRLVATTGAHHPNGEMTDESAEQEWRNFGPMEGEEESISHVDPAEQNTSEQQKQQGPDATSQSDREREQAQAQSKVIADKLETVSIELFDLKVEHESTVAELDDTSRKYQIALRTLADLQEAIDDGRARPSSFLGVDGSREPRENGVSSVSRTLQSDLSSRTESPTLVEPSEAGASESSPRQETLMDAVKRLKRANAEKDINMAELNGNFEQLSDQHQTTLKYVEELKEELAKAPKEQSPVSETLRSPGPIRRSASQTFLGKDRETRVFTNLRDVAVEHLQGKPQAAQLFERNINDAAMEMKLRNDRLESLETELKKVREEIVVKNTMISGLTRERSARTATGLDLSMLSSMRDHVTQSQKKIASLLKTRVEDEEKMFANVQKMQDSLGQPRSGGNHLPGEFPASGDASSVTDGPTESTDEDHHQRTVELQREITQWQEKQRASNEAARASEEQLVATIAALETSLANSEALHKEQTAAASMRSNMRSPDSNADLEAEKSKHLEQVAALQKEIDGYKAASIAHTSKLGELESSYNKFMQEVEEEAQHRKLTESELQAQRDRCQHLERQIEQERSLSDFHQSGLKSLEESHEKEMEELRGTLAAQQRKSDSRLTEQLSKHQESTSALQEELTRAHVELSQLMHSVAVALDDENADSATLQTRLQAFAAEKGNAASKSRELSETLGKVQQELQAAKRIAAEQDAKIKELTAINTDTLKELERATEREQKSSQLVQELEEQLNASFDQHKTTQKRLSSTQADAEKAIEDHRSRMVLLERELSDMKRSTTSSAQGSHRGSLQAQDLNRTDSNTSHLRKSNSNQALPMMSPPPVTPLPPVPSDSPSQNPPRSPQPNTASFSFNTGPSDTEKALQSSLDERENRIKTIEKHLYAEKQLTQTLEEALVDLETQANKSKSEIEAWKKKAGQLESEAEGLKKQRGEMRNSLQAVEQERERRLQAEAVQKQLEDRMAQVQAKKKKKGGLNCF
ncbi:MAG: hypothetical protein Q9162_005068 [Coniocarpon cinnabarinum]